MQTINKQTLVEKYIKNTKYIFQILDKKPRLWMDGVEIIEKTENEDKYPYGFVSFCLDFADENNHIHISFANWKFKLVYPSARQTTLHITFENKFHEEKPKGALVNTDFLVYKIFWSKWKGQNIEFMFDETFHLVDVIKESNNPVTLYRWDITPTEANFIFNKLRKYIPKNKIIVGLPAERYTLLQPWQDAGYITVGLDINEFKDSSSSIKGNFLEFSAEKWKEWLWDKQWYEHVKDGKYQVGLIMGYLPSFELPHSMGDSKLLWFKKIWEVWGKDVPVLVKSSSIFNFYSIGRLVKEEGYPAISQKISLPQYLSFRDNCGTKEIALFNLSEVEPTKYDAEFDLIEKKWKQN